MPSPVFGIVSPHISRLGDSKKILRTNKKTPGDLIREFLYLLK